MSIRLEPIPQSIAGKRPASLWTAVIVHGCDRGVPDWRRVVVGDADKGLGGRGTIALKTALRLNADAIYWGSARVGSDGLAEGTATFRAVVQSLPWVSDLIGVDRPTAEAFLRERSIFAPRAETTGTELSEALAVFPDFGPRRLCLVSGGEHLPRCLSRLCELAFEDPAVEIMAVPSATCSNGTRPGFTTIFEEPHRVDRDSLPVNRVVRRIFAVPAAALPSVLFGLIRLLAEHGVSGTGDLSALLQSRLRARSETD